MVALIGILTLYSIYVNDVTAHRICAAQDSLILRLKFVLEGSKNLALDQYKNNEIDFNEYLKRTNTLNRSIEQVDAASDKCQEAVENTTLELKWGHD